MKLIYKYLAAIALLCWLYPVMSQNREIVKGITMSIDSSRTVPLANILNKTTGQRFISSRAGFFRAQFAPGDSIQITAIGYESLLFVARDILPETTDDTVQLYMRPTAYQLRDVNIVYSNKKQDSLARLAAEFLKTDPLMNNYDRVMNRDKGGLFSPLTALFMEYSKQGKDMQKFEDFVRHAEMLKQVDRRYNKRTIQRATGLEDEYLDEYILFCRLDRTFILSSSDYELILAMRQCADRFRDTKGITR
jgi:hypothetical protein